METSKREQEILDIIHTHVKDNGGYNAPHICENDLGDLAYDIEKYLGNSYLNLGNLNMDQMERLNKLYDEFLNEKVKDLEELGYYDNADELKSKLK